MGNTAPQPDAFVPPLYFCESSLSVPASEPPDFVEVATFVTRALPVALCHAMVSASLNGEVKRGVRLPAKATDKAEVATWSPSIITRLPGPAAKPAAFRVRYEGLERAHWLDAVIHGSVWEIFNESGKRRALLPLIKEDEGIGAMSSASVKAARVITKGEPVTMPRLAQAIVGAGNAALQEMAWIMDLPFQPRLEIGPSYRYAKL